MTLSLPTPLPVPVSLSVGSCYFKGENDTATLKVPLIEEELKYFYANYKDYYYLPEEDVALHKSVADLWIRNSVYRLPQLPAIPVNIPYICSSGILYSSHFQKGI